MYLRVFMDSATCHWVRVSAMVDTLEWIAAAKVDLLHYCRTSIIAQQNSCIFACIVFMFM